MLRPKVFAHLQNKFGPNTIDQFASWNNVQVYPPRYFSKFFQQEEEGVDAFLCHWKYNEPGELENNRLHPPYAMIGAVARHLLACDTQATLIAPPWIATQWWPSLAEALPSTNWTSLGLCSDALVYYRPTYRSYDGEGAMVRVDSDRATA